MEDIFKIAQSFGPTTAVLFVLGSFCMALIRWVKPCVEQWVNAHVRLMTTLRKDRRETLRLIREIHKEVIRRDDATSGRHRPDV